MIPLIAALSVAFAAVCIWLTVRLINRRERWVKWTLGAAVAFGGLSMAIVPGLQTAYWVGRANRVVQVTVTDTKTGQPVANADVIVFKVNRDPGIGMPASEPDDSHYQTQHFSTDPRGTAKATLTFQAAGRESLFTNVASVRLGDQFIRVTASGYEPATFPFAEQVGDLKDYFDRSPIKLAVKLKPAVK